jgi:tRNA U34 5-carboxymethylaminomethyl modifying enzyme MnmG/GidA
VRQYQRYFRTAADIHEHATRRREDIFLEPHSLNSPYTCMVKMYNSLPAEVKAKKRFFKYVDLLKTFVHSRRFYCEEEFLSCK